LLQFALSKIPILYAYFTTVHTSPPIFGGYALKNAPASAVPPNVFPTFWKVSKSSYCAVDWNYPDPEIGRGVNWNFG
jgi:hypothetical protein